MAFRLPGKSAAISLTRLTADFGPALPPFRCGTNPELPRLRGTGGPPVTPARPCTIRGLSFPDGYPPGGGLLPRLFTLTRFGRNHAGRYFFCDTFRPSGLASGLPLVSQGGLSCGVRTFLPSPTRKWLRGDCPSSNARIRGKRRKANLPDADRDGDGRQQKQISGEEKLFHPNQRIPGEERDEFQNQSHEKCRNDDRQPQTGPKRKSRILGVRLVEMRSHRYEHASRQGCTGYDHV